ncbi:hypothetical protein FLW53_23975 [Microbispora sp. SCL1-1]|uniref:hypothetical protein n=1 Tax=unclassified Microbispora TaxID=2614687 RepID=UPI00115C0164|nr:MULTISPECIES: hypothetical protein [unclassified Microbispora]NJP27202.1 hypothetical protein [Microbispora sp. CL1-1]TQS11536.1 hypothetical protein FLW53_23975 [Microbispora sp. SCL1-1]
MGRRTLVPAEELPENQAEPPHVKAARRLMRQLDRALQQQYETSYPLFLGTQLRVPMKGSPCHGDLLVIGQERKKFQPALMNLRQIGHHAAELAIANMLDHLHALRRTVDRDEVPLFAHTSVMRTVVEAAAIACRWYDPSASTVVRLLRAAVGHRYDAEQDKKGCDALPDHLPYTAQARQEARNRFDDARKLIAEAGITEGLGRDGKTVAHLVWHDGTKIPTKIEWSGEVATLFPDLPNIYQIGSGAIHSVPWHLSEVLIPSIDAVSGFRAAPNPLSIAGAVDAALAACGKVLQHFGAFYGLDVTELIQKMEVRRRTVFVYMQEYIHARDEARNP